MQGIEVSAHYKNISRLSQTVTKVTHIINATMPINLFISEFSIQLRHTENCKFILALLPGKSHDAKALFISWSAVCMHDDLGDIPFYLVKT